MSLAFAKKVLHFFIFALQKYNFLSKHERKVNNN